FPPELETAGSRMSGRLGLAAALGEKHEATGEERNRAAGRGGAELRRTEGSTTAQPAARSEATCQRRPRRARGDDDRAHGHEDPSEHGEYPCLWVCVKPFV